MTRFEDIDPDAYGEWLSKRSPTDRHVAAARAAVDISDGRHADEKVMKDAAVDVSHDLRDDQRDMFANSTRQARAREVDGLSDEAKAEDNAATRNARWAEKNRNGVQPEPRETGGYQRSEDTEAALKMAREWMADRDLAERQRRKYGGVDDDPDTAIEPDDPDTTGEARTRVHER